MQYFPLVSKERVKVHILVGICSCHAARERREACRETWLSSIPEEIACKFFLGNKTKDAASSPEDEKCPSEDFSDVVELDVNDSYSFLPAKGIAFYKYALQHYDFDWLFKCDDDTYVALERLASVCREGYDMIGDISVAKRGAPSGGAGYLMSRQLVEQFVAHESEISKTGAEDVIFGCTARALGARMCADERLNLGNTPSPMQNNELVSCHWCSPQKLRDIHLLRFHQDEAEVYTAVHPYWRDEIRFFPNGRFMRCQSGCCGKYSYEDGKRVLRLIWDEWPEERLELQPGGHYLRVPGFCIFMGEEDALPMECMPGERPLKCVILTTPGEVVEGARRAMQLGYEVEIYPTTQDTSSLTDTLAEDSAAYINRPPESAERPHVRSLRASFIRALRDSRYQGQENIIFCESDAVPTMPAAELLRYVQETLNAHPNADVLRPFQALCTLDHLVEDSFTQAVEFSRMERHRERDCCTPENWGTHALIVPCRSREKLAKIFAEYRLPTDVALGIANGRDELEVYTCSHDLFYQKRREKLPRRHRIAGLLSSYKRLKELQRQIGCMMAQDDEDFHLFVAIKGISERDYHRIIEPQFRHFVQAGRLTMRLFPNRNQLSNLLDTVRDLDISSWDLFAKIDDDDIYAHDYISQLQEYHAMLPEGLGSYHCGDGGYYHLEKGFPVVGVGHFGFYGPTLVIPKRVLELLFDYEKEPMSVLRHFPVAEHGYLLSSFSFKEDALIDFINRRMGACNRAAYACVQGNELSVIVCQDTPSVLRGNYVSHDLMQQVEGTRLDKRANEQLLYLVHPHWSGYLRMLGTRVRRLDQKEEGNAIYFEHNLLIIKWDNWGEEMFEKDKEGTYSFKQANTK